MNALNVIFVDINNICFSSLFNSFSKYKKGKSNSNLLINEQTNLLLDNYFENLLNSSFEMMFNNIHNIQTYNIILNNISDNDHFIFFYVKDCSTKNNWRQTIFEEYKLNRILRKREFDYNAVFNYLYNKIDNLVSDKNCILYDQNLEADDIIYYGINILKNNNAIKNQIIVSNDSDYFQLHDKRIYQIDCFGNQLKIEEYFYKIVKNSKKALELYNTHKDLVCNNRFFKLFKILSGDTGDNIPPVLSDQKIGKIKLFVMLLTEQKKLQDMISTNEKYRNSFKLNTKLIDLSRIPIDYINQIGLTINNCISEYKKKISNNNDMLNSFNNNIKNIL